MVAPTRGGRWTRATANTITLDPVMQGREAWRVIESLEDPVSAAKTR